MKEKNYKGSDHDCDPNHTAGKEAALNAVAQAQGVSTEQWLQHLVEERLQGAAPTPSSSQPLSERKREIWTDLPDEARAEYPEGGAHQIDHHV